MKNAILFRPFGLMLMLLCFALTAPPDIFAQEDNTDQIVFFDNVKPNPEALFVHPEGEIFIPTPGMLHLAGQDYSAFDQLNIADIHIDLPAARQDKQRYRSNERINLTIYITIEQDPPHDRNGILSDNFNLDIPIVQRE